MMDTDTNAVELATALTVAWLSNTHTRIANDDVGTFLTSMHDAVTKLAALVPAEPQAGSAPDFKPAVSVRKSLASPDHIISMIDGKPYRALRRHLSTNGLTPDEHRQRYGLKADYPMVAATYSEARRTAAKSHNFGRTTGQNAGKAARPKANTGGGGKTKPTGAPGKDG